MSRRSTWILTLAAGAACLVCPLAAHAGGDGEGQAPNKGTPKRPPLARHEAEGGEEFGEHLEATSRAAALRAGSALAAARAKRNGANADHNAILQEYERSVTEFQNNPTEKNGQTVVANKFLLKDSYNKALKAQQEVNDAKETLAQSEQNLINVQKKRNLRRGAAINSGLHQLSPETAAYLNQVEQQRARRGAQLPQASRLASEVGDRRIFQKLPAGPVATATATAQKTAVRQQYGSLAPEDGPSSSATNSTAVRQQYGSLAPEEGPSSSATNSTAVRQQYGSLAPEEGPSSSATNSTAVRQQYTPAPSPSTATNSTAPNSGVVTAQRTTVRQQRYGQLAPETGSQGTSSSATSSTAMNGPNGEVNQDAVVALATRVPPPPVAAAAQRPRNVYSPAPARLQNGYDAANSPMNK